MEKLKKELEKLVNIMATLRGPDGCPWDKKQDYFSLKPYILEEAYEVVETLIEEDIDALKEELGDLLLQIVFQAQMGKENGDFDLKEIIENINKKLIRRHPHVFSDVEVENVNEVLTNWEKIKDKENESKNKRSILEDVSKNQPALIQSYEIQKKAEAVGFDWDESEEVIKKIREELNELTEAVAKNQEENINDEIGDLLFSVVNLSRFYEINPETSLFSSVIKFKRRFKYIEEEVEKSEKDFNEYSLKELDEFWEKAKKKYKVEGDKYI